MKWIYTGGIGMEQGSWYTVYYLVSYPLYLYYYNFNTVTRIRYWSMYYVQCNVQPSDCNHSRDSSVEWARREHGIHWAGMHVIQYPLYIPFPPAPLLLLVPDTLIL